jgi:hypothetical protein
MKGRPVVVGFLPPQGPAKVSARGSGTRQRLLTGSEKNVDAPGWAG